MLRNETDFVVCRKTVSVDDGGDLGYVQTVGTTESTTKRPMTMSVH